MYDGRDVHSALILGNSTLSTQNWSYHKTRHQWLLTYLPRWQRWEGGCRTFWWWYRWTAGWWVSCQAGGCSFETPASGALDDGPGLSSQWLCSSPSNGQTPWAGERSETPQLTPLPPSQRVHPAVPSRHFSLGERKTTIICNICQMVLRPGALNPLWPTNIYWVLLVSCCLQSIWGIQKPLCLVA